MERLSFGVAAAATVLLVVTACGSKPTGEPGASSSRASRSSNTSPSPTAASTTDKVVCKRSEPVKNSVLGVLNLCDATDDVWEIKRRLPFPDADIRTAVVRHQGERLDVTLNFAAPIDPKAGHQVAIYVRTDSGAQPQVDMIFGPEQHDSWLYKDTAKSDFDPACSPTLNNDLAHGRITVQVERRCLGDPRWVQVQIEHDRQGLHANGNQFDYWDNPHSNGASPRRYTTQVTYQP